MKIGIDISQIVYGTGVSRYTKHLVENLLFENKDNQYLLFAGSMRQKETLTSYINSLQKPNLSSKVVSLPPTFLEFLWNNLHIFSIENFTGPLDVFHTSDWTEPPARCAKVTTVHDLAPILFPELTPKKVVNSHNRRLRWVKAESDRIIVPSVSTANDLEKLGFDKKRIRVIPEAAEKPIKATPEEIKKVKDKYHVQNEYLLAIGVNPRKNTERILRAFELINAEFKGNLILVGRKQVQLPEVRGVRVTGSISDQELKILYSGASAIVYPSLYEGFGLPVLEGMAYGKPVVTSNVSSLPEVAGNAGILVDPYSVEDITHGIKKALRNKISLTQKGLKQADKYSWAKTARETLKVYKELTS